MTLVKRGRQPELLIVDGGTGSEGAIAAVRSGKANTLEMLHWPPLRLSEPRPYLSAQYAHLFRPPLRIAFVISIF
jgi:hypothetical protein